MKKNSLTLTILLIFTVCFTTIAIAETDKIQFTKDWAFISELTFSKLIQDSKIYIIGTSGLSWPDGSQAIILHIKTKNDYYRVIEYYDKDMRKTRSGVYKLNLKSK